MIGGRFAPLTIMSNEDTDIDSMITTFITAVTETASKILGKHRQKKKNWIGEQYSEIEENLRKNNSKRAYQLVKDLTTVKQGKATTVQDRSGKMPHRRATDTEPMDRILL